MNEFWALRALLWPDAWNTKSPMMAPEDSDLDRLIAKVMRKRGLNAAKQDLPNGLADDPWHHGLRPLFGKGFAPFREMRQVWIPTAIHFAEFEGRKQTDRFALLERNDDVLGTLVKALENDMAAFQQPGIYDILRAWGSTPLDRFFRQGLVLEQFIGSICEQFKLIREEIVEFKVYASDRTAPEFHRSTDYRGRAMATVLAMAWARLVDLKEDEKINRTAFDEFVTAACYAAKAEPPKITSINAMLALDLKWNQKADLSELVRLTEEIWPAICEVAPFDNENNESSSREDLASAMYDAIMMPDDIKKAIRILV